MKDDPGPSADEIGAARDRAAALIPMKSTDPPTRPVREARRVREVWRITDVTGRFTGARA